MSFLVDVEGTAPEQINVYGDGAMKCPTSQWLALGGFGVWWPHAKLNRCFEDSLPQAMHAPTEENQEGVGLWNCMKGHQDGAWGVCGSTGEGCPGPYGDGQPEHAEQGNEVVEGGGDLVARRFTRLVAAEEPIRKPWGLQADGDL